MSGANVENRGFGNAKLGSFGRSDSKTTGPQLIYMKRKSLVNSEALDNAQEEEHNDVEFEDIDEEARITLSVKKVRDKLKACETEKKEYLDGWQRSKADFLNARKQDAKTLYTAVMRSKESMVLDILPILDSFDMAFSDKAKDQSPEWSIGIQNIHSQLLSILKEHNVVVLNPKGEIFDTSKHDSIETIDTDKKKDDNHIVKVLQKGYEMNGRLIRAAKVKVAHLIKK